MMSKEDYIEALEEERRKIHVFQRELPLCLELVTRTIEELCGEQTTSDCPVLEEFIPLKKASDFVEEQGDSEKKKNGNSNKSDWLRSVQLWSQNPDPPSISKQISPRKVSVIEVNRNGDFAPAENRVAPSLSGSSTAERDDSKEKQDKRKTRRCWSMELHERFLHALQQLGGSKSATPKQIREVMKVDGLTNDEVKSHLQKYRLHKRKPVSLSLPATTEIGEQAPQFVVVGGIWVPPDFTSTGAVESPGTKIDAPNPKPGNAYPFRDETQLESDGKGCSEGVQSHMSGKSSV